VRGLLKGEATTSVFSRWRFRPRFGALMVTGGKWADGRGRVAGRHYMRSRSAGQIGVEQPRSGGVGRL
jgi:hypothetical protein